jgi:hypothetical protein
MTNYVYIKSEPQLWTVGFYNPQGKWQPESDWDIKEDAAKRVHYLNGRDNNPYPDTEAGGYCECDYPQYTRQTGEYDINCEICGGWIHIAGDPDNWKIK